MSSALIAEGGTEALDGTLAKGPDMPVLRCRRPASALSGAVIAILLAATPTLADEPQVRGVNPADIDTRLDVIGKYNWLNNGASVFTTTLKYDYRINDQLGVNFEFPLLGNFRAPGVSAPKNYFPENPDGVAPILESAGSGGLNRWGVGDLYSRIRYIQPFGRVSLGGALEAVWPAASDATLGTGKYQLNPAALGVYAWSPSLISAVVVKSTNSIGGNSSRPDISFVTLRGVQAFVFPNRMFATLDVQHSWETINARDRWWETAAELGRQFSPTFVGSLRISRRYGDRSDKGAIEFALKHFF